MLPLISAYHNYDKINVTTQPHSTYHLSIQNIRLPQTPCRHMLFSPNNLLAGHVSMLRLQISLTYDSSSKITAPKAVSVCRLAPNSLSWPALLSHSSRCQNILQSTNCENGTRSTIFLFVIKIMYYVWPHRIYIRIQPAMYMRYAELSEHVPAPDPLARNATAGTPATACGACHNSRLARVTSTGRLWCIHPFGVPVLIPVDGLCNEGLTGPAAEPVAAAAAARWPTTTEMS